MPDDQKASAPARKTRRAESYVLARGHVAYLKITGKAPEWQLMTATVGDATPPAQACADPARLVEAALIIGHDLQTQPTVQQDRFKREVATICTIVDDMGDDEHFQREMADLFLRFFEVYDRLGGELPEGAADPADLPCQILPLNGASEPVHFSCGSWLPGDGSTPAPQH